MSNDGPPRDHVGADAEETEGSQRLEAHLKSRSTWLRVLFMLVVLVLWGVSRVVVGAVVLFQLGCLLFTGAPNKALVDLGRSLAAYTYEIVMYLTFASDLRPFPLDSAWPDPAAGVRPAAPGTGDDSQRLS